MIITRLLTVHVINDRLWVTSVRIGYAYKILKGVITIEEIRCTTCNKLLCESSGEVKKICPKCKNVTHVVVTSKGIIDLNVPK